MRLDLLESSRVSSWRIGEQDLPTLQGWRGEWHGLLGVGKWMRGKG